MPLPEILRYAIAIALSTVLVWAGVSDIIHRRIPNTSVLVVLGLFVLWALVDRGQGLASSLVAAAVAFAVGYGLYVFKIVGAGDAKLFAALALFIGLAHLPMFALLTVWAGGLIAIGTLITRPRRAMLMWSLKGKGNFGRGIPYGVAIGAGGAVVLWGYLTGLLPLERIAIG